MFKILFGKVLKKEKKKEKEKGRETPALGLMAQSAEAQSFPPRARFSPSPLTRPTPAPRPSTRTAQLRPAARLLLFSLCFADNRGPRGSVLFIFPTSSPSRTRPAANPTRILRDFLALRAQPSAIKLVSPPRGLPFRV